MDVLIYIFGIIGIIEIIITVSIDWRDESIAYMILGSAITSIVISFVGVALIITETKIEPIDVYRGKTTLQVTYQDSVPIDSVVVYK